MTDDQSANVDEVTTFAPGSIGNVAVGYDVLGSAVSGIGDRVTVRRLDEPVVRMGAITGCVTNLPTVPADNTAGAAVQSLLAETVEDVGFEISIEKGIPLRSGLGGSAASAVGAVVGAASLLSGSWSKETLLTHALTGEEVASGERHPDNVVPILLGGLVLTREVDPPDLVSLPVPARIRCVLVRPDQRVSTRDARRHVPDTVSVSTCMRQAAHLGAFVAGCHRNDLGLVGRSLRDLLVEPHRAELVPGFHDVQSAALEAGALGCSLSGSGPTMFAWCVGAAAAQRARDAMVDAFEQHDVTTETWIASIPREGARVESRSTA